MRKIVLLLLLALGAAGCATTGGGGGPGDAMVAIHLFGMPVTANLDTKPGPDGFAIRVYLTKANDAKGAALRKGTVEVLMFDGVVPPAEITVKPPHQLWKFTAAQLASVEEKTAVGYGYHFALRWKEAPKRGHITVVARYLPPKGEPIYSAPSTIASVVR